MAAFNDHEAGNNHDVVRAFDYTEEMESPFQNLDADTEELDIPHFVGDLRALMVDDSEDEIVLDSDDDEAISDQKHGKIRGSLWRHAQSVDVRSSAGSNLTDKVSNNENEIVDTKCSKGDQIVNLNDSSINFQDENLVVNESPQPGESSEANALEFVDHYLSISGVNSSPEFKIQKHESSRSPFSSCAKGSQNLAMNLKTSSINKAFDWDIDQPDHGCDIFSEKKVEDEGFEELSKHQNDDNVDIFDVGLDTQMAAEAMESLIYATPPCIHVNQHQDLKIPSKELLFSLSDSQINGISFNQKRAANKKHQMSTFFYNKNQKELVQNLGNPENWDNIGEPKKKVYEKSLKVYKRKKKKTKKQDLEKENIKPDDMEKVNSFSPVASRTRHGSSVKPSKRPYNGMQIDVNDIRKLGDLKFEIWNWPKKKRTCRNMRENAIKSGEKYEAFLMSSVKRKKRSVSMYRSASGKNLSMNINMITESLNGEENIKDLSSNEKNKTPSMISNQGLSGSDFTSKDLRRRRSKVEIRVLFSQSLDDDVIKHQKKILENLGICLVTNISEATHLVADRFARTKKMLEAMCLGKQIVTPLWLESCQLAGCIIDEKKYVLRDYEKEKEMGFCMPISLSRATKHPLLKGKSVFITPNVEPGREIIENLVKAVHGQVMIGFKEASMEYKTSDDILILSCEQDYVLCVPFLDKGVPVYSSELLLNGIIIQKLEYSKHQLFKGHVIMKRYVRKRKKSGSLHLDVPHGG